MIGAIRRRDTRGEPQPNALLDVERMAALVRECIIAGIARNCCIVHLSRLPPDQLRPHHMRLARAALEPLAHADRARLFELPTLDLVVIWRGAAETAVSVCREAITLLFAEDDPIAPSAADATIWQELSLPEEAGQVLAMADAILQGDATPAASTSTASPLDPASLAAFEARLAQVDVTRFVRRRQICVRLPDGGFRLRWEKRYLSVDELQASLAPDHAAQAEPWLFRRLTRSLDRRMLALLAAPAELDGAGPFSINLNVASILSPEFLRFDEALPPGLRGQVTLDFLPADVLADPAAFLFAREFASSRGYRTLLRGITADLLPVFPLARIGLDFLQLRWSPALAALGTDLFPDPLPIVLSHADTPSAMAWGRREGILLYQGRFAEPGPARALRSGG